MRLSVCLTVFVLCFFVFSVSAQEPVRDSVKYYNAQLGKYYRRIWDSIYHTDSALYYWKQMKRVKDRSKSYTAFMLFTDVLSTDFSTLNAAIAKDGFGPMGNAPYWRVGLGLSHKGYNGIVFDFNYIILGFNRVAHNGNEKITANVSELLGFQLGYAVVNCRKFTLYPYAGLDIRLATLSYDKPAVVNPVFNSIAGIVQNDQSVSGGNTHLSYQAGLGIDWVIHENKKTHGGTMLFGKFVTTGIFGDETYSIDGEDLKTGIKYGVWAAQLGFKFFGR